MKKNYTLLVKEEKPSFLVEEKRLHFIGRRKTTLYWLKKKNYTLLVEEERLPFIGRRRKTTLYWLKEKDYPLLV